MTKVLIIEDDPILGEMLTLYLEEECFEVLKVETARDGYSALDTFNPDAIILDLLLPDTDGSTICSSIRDRTNIPIIVTSMKNAVTDRIRAISSGADDYLTKPYSVQELKARLMASLRRMPPGGVKSAAPTPPAARIALDMERRFILLEGKPIETTFSEFEIMKLFTQHPGRVFQREELLNSVRGIDSFVNERSVDVHITNLRRKIEPNPKTPQHIKTVWGVGYKFVI